MIEITDFSSHIYNNMARKKKCKTLVGGARGCFFCLALARTFRTADKAVVAFALRSQGTSEHPQSSTEPERVHPGTVTVDGLIPLLLTSACACLLRIQRGPTSPPRAPPFAS